MKRRGNRIKVDKCVGSRQHDKGWIKMINGSRHGVGRCPTLLMNGLSAHLFCSCRFEVGWGEALEWNNLRTFAGKEKVMSYLDEIKLGLSALKPELSGRFHVSIIGLFGSVVRSDFSPTASDIDIIVDFSQPVGVEFIDLANYLESKFHKKIDLVSRGGIKPKYYSAIEKDIVYV